MARYVDKDALVAEIEKLESRFQNGSDDEEYADGYHYSLELVKRVLDTLEVKKEVDLEKELIEWHKKHFKKDGTFIGMSGFYLTNNSQIDIAKYFYELGLNAKKENSMTALEKFKELPHINSNYEIQEDWAYTPNLYHFDGGWHVSWIHCEDGDSLDDFSGSTPEEAIDKAYNWFHRKFCND